MEIHLTTGGIAVIDDEDAPLVRGYSWRLDKVGVRARVPGGFGKVATLHRLVMHAKKNEVIHHIDGDLLNCRKSNLFKRVKSESVRGEFDKGYNFCNTKNKWRAYTSEGGKRIHLGYFDNEKDAADARKKLGRLPKYIYFREDRNSYHVRYKDVSYGYYKTEEAAKKALKSIMNGTFKRKKRGVRFCKSSEKFRAYSKEKYLGRFPTREAAEKAIVEYEQKS